LRHDHGVGEDARIRSATTISSCYAPASGSDYIRRCFAKGGDMPEASVGRLGHLRKSLV
jgi:hypothetical protein